MQTGRFPTIAATWTALCVFLILPVPILAKQRALIIGIDQYAAPQASTTSGVNPPNSRGWRSLAGAVNDAIRMRDLLQARFGFEHEAIQTLLDHEATRNTILAAVRHIIATSDRGDVFLFYFAGHGSRVRNSRSPKADRLDESIVPADAPLGARDIRDKELRELFNRLIDAGVVVTAIFDSCHSGSIARGPLGLPVTSVRMLPIDPRDVMDASEAPNPADRGALILSASQDDEVAHEHLDRFGRAGGLFTIGLTRALLAAAPGEPAMNIFRRTFASMRDSGRTQNPVIEGSAERRRQSLLAESIAADTERPVTVSVRSVRGSTVMLHQGIAAGMTEGTELVMVGNEPVRLRLSRVTGLAASTAQVIAGSAATIHPGSLFVVDPWAAPAVPELRVFASTTDLTVTQLLQLHRRLQRAVRSRGYGWVSDPMQTPPTHVITHQDETWWLIPPEGELRPLGNELTEKQVIEVLGSDSRPRPNIFLNLPLPEALRGDIRLGPNTANPAVAWVPPEQADYHLISRVKGDALELAWVRPWNTGAAGTLPQRSDWIVANTGREVETGAQLTTRAARLARVSAWLNLEAPPARKQTFPYRLVLKRKDSSEHLEHGLAYANEPFELALVSDRPPPATTPRRFVYVFTIDGHGGSTLIIPRSAAVENRFPREADDTPRATYVLPETGFTIHEPFGTDTFVLLTTSEQLPDPWVLEWDAARSRSGYGAPRPASPLGNLLTRLGAPTRGQLVTVLPESWSIQRIAIETSAGR